jgi:hypothetical protein
MLGATEDDSLGGSVIYWLCWTTTGGLRRRSRQTPDGVWTLGQAYDPEATAAPGTPGGHLPLDRRARKAWVDSELAAAVQLARVRHELAAAFEARASANRELRRVAGEAHTLVLA